MGIDVRDMTMAQNSVFPILVPLAVGAIPTVSTILIHALAVMATVSFVRRERRLGRVGVNFGKDVWIVTLTISLDRKSVV